MNRKINAIVLVFLLAVAGLTAAASDRMPSNDFFAPGQQWTLQRISGSGDDQTVDNVTVSVQDGPISYLEGTYAPYGSIELECRKLTVAVNGEMTDDYFAGNFLGTILVKSKKKSDFVPFLDFKTSNADMVTFDGKQATLESSNYIYAGNLLRKRVNVTSDGMAVSYVFGLGAKEWSVTSDHWSGNYTYRLVSMTTTDGEVVGPGAIDLPVAVCDNSFWTQDKRWEKVTYYPADYEMPDVHRYWKVDGTVTLDSKNGAMTCPNYVECESDWTVKTPGPSYPVVSINGQVYRYDKDEEERFMLEYDFNAEVGQYALPGIADTEVTAVDQITVKNREYKRIVFAGASQPKSDCQYWVEGIGSKNCRNTLWMQPYPADGSNERLEAVYQGDECIFTYFDFDGVDGVRIIPTTPADFTYPADSRTFDLQGREVTNPRTGTILIRNGKKTISR